MNTPLKVLVRPPAPSFVNALTQQPNADRISIDKARRQHDAYVQALKTAGLEVIVLDPLDDFPDSVFIEDNAVILGSRALLCSMKPESRRGEPPHLAEALQKHMHVAKMEPPAFIDGGDVLQTESTVFVGQSNRTNTDALQTIRQYTSK
ncbi:MAG: N(G),N(G)-dimethylarginine dimethylaminohydrolase, partial [Nitrospinaceae bacterium]|nr:N(G),N(G)-dimethylarginine dimethylaminohydrolase [Nitrospinaceae bacterium]NIR56316.1 N(G),N(G)-dimethylarginine dimethylaminohydrolase [Nitrospinaceae bacterium]NIS86773.1 N(G),N(G)-dimethylarginine dimethylaminohydrolase [Nitrospinaceae bacterium]NIT83608.1 N(G),N(G)-dimethylarginine dimethylaminohydrolase [Nitrospinaceae bacterium]NIU45810.1 N(G),N(G)-dimethylarginine dimethylaminohydrolase [Nitrospinaceae bacterium]